MRIREPKSELGYFWLPSMEHKQISGLLTISDGGKTELEIHGLFDETSNNDLKDYQRIVGVIEGQGMVTLEDCKCINQIHSSTVSKSVFSVQIALFGHAFNKNERINFNTVWFSVEGLDEWVGINGAEIERQQTGDFATIKYKRPDPISFELSNGMSMKIEYTWSPPTNTDVTEVKISQKAYLSLSSQDCLELRQFTDTARRITMLLCFAIDEIVCVDEFIATTGNKRSSSYGESVPIYIYKRTSPFTPEIPEVKQRRFMDLNQRLNQREMLFNYKDIETRAETTINKWLEICEESYPSVDIFLATKEKSQAYLESKILALAQCFETYHRRTSDEYEMDEAKYTEAAGELLKLCPDSHILKQWLKGKLSYGNELNFRKRVRSLILPFKKFLLKSNEFNALLNNIVKTRNYLTHYDKSMDSSVKTDVMSLHLLYQKMDLLFQLHLLRILGFELTSIRNILKNKKQLEFKLEGR